MQFHGDFGPGGGFQAGVITAAAVILYAHHLRRRRPRSASCPSGWSSAWSPLGVLIYAGVGVAGLLLGGNYLDYFVLAARPGRTASELGIFWVEARRAASRSPAS